MSVNLLFEVIYLSILLCSAVQGTLTPNGTVTLDCGSQQTFNCNVSGVAAWNITGFGGISVTIPAGLSTARDNARITTTDTSGATPSSTITITGFNISYNGGSIRCIDLDDFSVQGMVSISVGPPSCSANFTSVRIGSFTSATVTYKLATPPSVTSTELRYI